MPAMFSSVQTPEMAKKKKKDKSADGSEKKRKHEDEQQDGSAERATEPKKKKSKQQLEPAAPPMPSTDGGVPVATAPAPVEKSAKKSSTTKKEKQSTGDKSVSPASSQPTGTDPTPSKKRKKKDRQDTVGEQRAAYTSALASSSKSLALGQQHDRQTANKPRLSDDELLLSNAAFETQTKSFYVTLSPCANNFPLEGLLAEHISPLLLTYYPPVRGVVIDFGNAQLSEDPDDPSDSRQDSGNEGRVVLSKAIDEYAVTYIWLTVEFSILRPSRGAYLEGYVNLQNESLLGLICYNYYNAGIERQRLPKDWRWVAEVDAEGSGRRHGKEGNGHWVDGSGKKVEGRLVFRVRDFEAAPGSETGAGSVNIYGTLLSEEDDRRVDDEERQHGLVSNSTR